MRQLLDLCILHKAVTKDGGAGATAGLHLPFYGYWRAAGGKLQFQGGTIAQDKAPFTGTQQVVNTFRKGLTCDQG